MLQGRTSLEVSRTEIGARRVAELLWRLHYGIAAGSPKRVRIYRIADHRHPIWDGTGTAVLGGRRNNVGRPLIDASASYARAMLEVLAHAGAEQLPRAHRDAAVDVPESVAIERRAAEAVPAGWDLEDGAAARIFGARWLEEGRTALLIVPSVVARIEWNALINPRHPDATQL